MPWPFDNQDFEDLFKEFEKFHHPKHHIQRDDVFNKKRQISENPRAYFLHDPRHINERKKSNSVLSQIPNAVADTEINLDGNLQALLENDSSTSHSYNIPNPHSSNTGSTRESISSTWSMKNGKMCKQERREIITGRTRRVSITSTDEDGHTTTHEYSEEI